MSESERQSASGPAFSQEALERYQKILERYPVKRAALMPVLWLAQEQFGWLSPEVQSYVARLMDLPLIWVEGVTSFYTMYYTRRMGRHHLELCTNLSCQLRGADQVLAAISRRLGIKPGETSDDMAFSLDRAECLGACEAAPVLQLSGGEYIGDLDVEKAMDLLDELEKGDG